MYKEERVIWKFLLLFLFFSFTEVTYATEEGEIEKIKTACTELEKREITPNSANIYNTWSDADFVADENKFEKIQNCDGAKGVFGIEAGTVANGEASTGGVFWFVENKDYDLKIGFNIGNSAAVDADFSNIGDIIRDSDEFGQFSLSFKKLIGIKSIRTKFGLLVDTSYTQIDFDGDDETKPDDGGLVAFKVGTFLPATQFDLTDGLTGTAILSLAFEHRRVVEDLANNGDDISRVFNGNDKSFSGVSTQIDLSLSNNQRYFIKFTKFNDADGISGLDGTQVTVGVKVDGIFEKGKSA